MPAEAGADPPGAAPSDPRAPVLAATRGPARGRWDFLRKGAAVLLVLTSVTVGMIGLGLLVDEGRLWAIGLLLATPMGIYAATRITPEGGTNGYCDQNI